MSASTDDQSSPPQGFVRTVQILAGALVAGVIFFLAIALAMRARKGLFAENPWDVMPPKGLVSLIALVTAATMAVLAFALPRQIAANLRRQQQGGMFTPTSVPARSLGGDYAAFQTQMIIGMALLEGAAFFNGIAYLTEGHIPNLIAVGVLIFLMIARFPTEGGIQAWVEDHRRMSLEERNAA